MTGCRGNSESALTVPESRTLHLDASHQMTVCSKFKLTTVKKKKQTNKQRDKQQQRTRDVSNFMEEPLEGGLLPR